MHREDRHPQIYRRPPADGLSAVKVSLGSGNPGATGVNFIGSNQSMKGLIEELFLYYREGVEVVPDLAAPRPTD